MTTTSSSPFLRAVVESMQTLYPECLADKSFDNTGLLLEAPFLPPPPPTAPPTTTPTTIHPPPRKNSVLLTIDLTSAVADEAIENGHSVVVAYHPIIFRGLKSLTLADSQQRSLLRLAAHGVSVYCPHTAVDVVPGGMGDWLCDIVTGSERESVAAKTATSTTTTRKGIRDGIFGPARYDLSTAGEAVRSSTSSSTDDRWTAPIPNTRSVITASPPADIDAANQLLARLTTSISSSSSSSSGFIAANTGAGRLIRFADAQPLSRLVDRIGERIGQPKAIAVAVPQGTRSLDDVQIRTVAVCPGSGASVTRACRPPPDLVFTGEVSHHDALAITERGGAVVTLFHSNSERGYLAAVMKPKLEDRLRCVWAAECARLRDDKLHDERVQVQVSERDKDPFGMAVLLNDPMFPSSR